MEALQLTRRRVWAYLCFGLLPLALSRIDNSVLLVTATFPLMLAGGCAVAKSADHSQSTFQCFREIGSRSWIRVFLIGAALPLALAAFSMSVESVGLDQLAQSQLSRQLSRNEPGPSVVFTTIIFVVCVLLVIGVAVILRSYCFLWFFWTLCILPELPASKALDQAVEGSLKNRFIVWPFTVSSVLIVVTLFLPVLFVVWFAITTSMMYVSYRDIWLMKPQNQLAKERKTIAKGIVHA